jgi:hypothetical protein
MRFVTESGTFTFSVGSSSADLRATSTIVLDGPLVAYQLRDVVDTAVMRLPL